MIGIIDYGMGNLLSVKNAVEMLGKDAELLGHPSDLTSADQLILPGVGAFRDCIGNLKSRGFIEALNEQVLDKGKPILGICLGMQVMATTGHEDGEHTGLGWFDADVVKVMPADNSFRVPHIGWNDLIVAQDSFLFNGLPDVADVYFVHSYYMSCHNKADVIAEFEYGGRFTAAIQKDNIVATQFHPEKSQDYGLKILENYLAWKP